MTIFEFYIFWIKIAPTYYWLMYALWFIFGFLIIKKRWIIYNSLKKDWLLDDLFMYIFLWVVLWWRIGYIIFYNFESFLSSPISIFKIWEWWMSFHWWVIWVLIAMYFFSRKNNIGFLKVADQVTLVLPIWLWLWRIWNYINWELLWFSWYTGLFAVYKDWIWYFPSPLLEAVLEWLILFIILNYIYIINNKKKGLKQWKKYFWLQDWQISALFLIFYALFRILTEIFVRTPDSHIWYIFWLFTLWEILSFPMLFWGLYYYFKLKK